MIKKGTEYRRGPMRPAPSSRILAAFVAIAILGVAFIVVPQGARADANAPTWTSGDFWVYTDASNPNHTLRVDVVGRENTRTLLGTTYDSFHTRETESTGSISLTTDKWVRTSDLGVVNSTVTVFNVVSITTFDPPQPQASFPLSAQKSWTVTLNVSIKIGGGQVFTASTSASAQVEGESAAVVAPQPLDRRALVRNTWPAVPMRRSPSPWYRSRSRPSSSPGPRRRSLRLPCTAWPSPP